MHYHSQSPVMVRATTLLAAAMMLMAGSRAALNANEGFHFRRFCNLKSGERFRIIARNGYSAGSAIGQGRIRKLNARELELEFRIETVATGSIDGSLKLVHLGARDRYKQRIRLSYSGHGPKGPENATETVLADSFLIDNGILSLHFSNRERFFQLSLDSRGRNSFITHWGASRLEAIH